MSMPLLKLIDNLSEGLHNDKCLNCKSCLDYIKTKMKSQFLNALIVNKIMKRILIKN